MKLAILSESEPHFGEKPAKWPKLAILSQSNQLFQQNLPLWVIFSQFGVKGIQKVEKLKKIADVPSPQEMQIFEISDEMRCFGGKRQEKLWIAWKWPFRMNLSLIMGKNLQNDQNWPFWANLTHFFG